VLINSNHPNSETSITLKVFLKHKNGQILPQNSQMGVYNPVFKIPIHTSSVNLHEQHIHLPKLESLAGISIAVFLNYNNQALLEEIKYSPPHKSLDESSNISNSSGSSDSNESTQISTKANKKEGGYLNFILNAMKNEIVGPVTSEYLGAGFVDLKKLELEDHYHLITVPIISQNHSVACKIDLSILISGVKTQILEMRNEVVKNNILPEQIFVKTFEKMVVGSNDFSQIRLTKQKVELLANKWINSHVASRVQVVSVDTTFINSKSGYELFTVQVWYKYIDSFIKESKILEEEQAEKVKKLKQEEVEVENKQVLAKEEENIDHQVVPLSKSDDEKKGEIIDEEEDQADF
jgi:hypothetical protein